MNNLLVNLFITFGSLILVGLIIFLVLYFIHKSAFNKLKRQVNKYNELRNKVYSINFYRLDVLAQNEMLNKVKFEQLKQNYKALKDNCHTIYINLTIQDDVVRKMNIKEANKISNHISKDLIKTEKELGKFIEQFNKSTQYSDGIEDALSITIDMFNKIKQFYYQNVIHNASFTKINELIGLIQKVINNNVDFSTLFDFDETVRIFSDLHSKIRTLWKSVIAVTKLQFVDVYLQSAKNSNEELIKKSKTPLHFRDVEFIQKANKVFDLNYETFKKAYLEFDLNKAQKYALLASKDMANISKFTYIHITSEVLVEESINTINEQTQNIISNKDKILNSISSLANYFAKDEKTTSYFKQLECDVKDIEALAESANSLDSSSTSEKLKALKSLQNISLSISKCKESISENVDKINDTLSNIINVLTHLNELYTYYIQMIPTIQMLSKNTPLRGQFLALINNNITLIKQCMKSIIEDDTPNYKDIGSKIARMIEETQKIKSKINSTIILKSYANKLILYANRFKKESNIDLFEKAEEEYKNTKYALCIDTLLAICKKYK